jgi:hypothetical protein
MTSLNGLARHVHEVVGKMFRAVFWVVLPCKIIVDNNF